MDFIMIKKNLLALSLVALSSAPAMSASLFRGYPVADQGTEGLKVIVNSTNDTIATYQGNSAA